MSAASIVSEVTDEIKPKKVQSEALKRAKATYLQQEEVRPRVHGAEQKQSKTTLHTKCRTPQAEM